MSLGGMWSAVYIYNEVVAREDSHWNKLNREIALSPLFSRFFFLFDISAHVSDGSTVTRRSLWATTRTERAKAVSFRDDFRECCGSPACRRTQCACMYYLQRVLYVTCLRMVSFAYVTRAFSRKRARVRRRRRRRRRTKIPERVRRGRGPWERKTVTAGACSVLLRSLAHSFAAEIQSVVAHTHRRRF